MAQNSLSVSVALYLSIPINTERELENGFELGFEPGLRTRASCLLLEVTKTEYSFSVLEMPTRKLEERIICFFPSSRKAKRFLVDDQR